MGMIGILLAIIMLSSPCIAQNRLSPFEESVIDNRTSIVESGIEPRPRPMAPMDITAYPYNEDFESGFGDWTNAAGDDFDWTRYSGSTTSSNTGPSGDHTTGSGYYLYTESSSNYNNTANLLSPNFDLSSVTATELTFWYHMYGSSMGSMHIDVSTDGGSGWDLDLWQLSGDQGNSWFEAVVDLSAYDGDNIIIRFRGITGSSYRSDMAIDDITVDGIVGPLTPDDASSGDDASDVYGSGNRPALSVGTEYNGNIWDTADLHDHYTLSLTAGMDYIFQLYDVPSSENYNLYLLDGTGTVIESSESGGDGLNEEISYTAVSTGTYYLRISPNSSSDYSDTEKYKMQYLRCFTICWTNPGGAFDFASFEEAITDLTTSGGLIPSPITGPITFLVYDDGGDYVERVGGSSGLGPISGASASNTIIFQAAEGESPVIDGDSYGIYLEGADYVTFDGLEVTSTTSYGIYFDDPDYSTHNTVRNCVIHGTNNYGCYFDHAEYLSFDHNIVYNTSGSYGVYLYYCSGSSSDNAEFYNNTIYVNATSRALSVGYCDYIDIKNNIIWNTSTLSGDYGLYLHNSDDYNTSYNYFASNYSADYGMWPSLGTGDIEVLGSADPPMFFSAGGGDFHLKSQCGRWWPELNRWYFDDPSEHSMCIDAGYPGDDYSAEPTPNGSNINQGAYGGTDEASKDNSCGLPTENDAGSGADADDTYSAGNRPTLIAGPEFTGHVWDATDAHDHYTISLQGGQQYSFVLNNLPETENYNLYLLDSGGSIVATSASAGNGRSESIIYTPVSTDTYYIRVSPNALGTDFSNSETYTMKYSRCFTICWTNPGGAFDYASFEEAITDITTSGGMIESPIQSPVTFLVYDDGGDYVERVGGSSGLGPISGASASNTIIFQAAEGESPVIDGDSYGIYLEGADYVTFDGLEVTSTTSYGIYFDDPDYSTHNTVRNCVIHGTNNYGCYFDHAEYLSFDHNIVYNTSGSYGVYLYYCSGSSSDNAEFYNNTIYVNATSRALSVGYCDYIDIKNNIIWNTSTLSGDYGLYLHNSDDYNTSYNYFASNYSATYGMWPSLGTGDVEVLGTTDPVYFASTAPGSEDFHIQSATTGHWDGSGWSPPDPNTSPCIDGGDPADDYSLEPAGNGSRINQGAYGNTVEATRTTASGSVDDAGISSIDAPVMPFCPGSNDVIVTLFNFGTNDLTSVTIRWWIDDGGGYVEQPSCNWNGFLSSMGSESVNVSTCCGSGYSFSAGTEYDIKVQTENPNGNPDSDPSNDDEETTNISPALSGTFTIGGASPNYATFNDAVSAMNSYGICDNTTFDVRDGTYDEKIILDELTYVTTAKTVTFQSESGDSSLVILSSAASGVADNYTVKFNGADNIIFQNMTIQATGAITASYSIVIDIGNASCNNQFLNNQLIGHSQSGFLISINKAIVFSDDVEASRDSNNVFRNNWFKDGTYGMYYQGWDHVLEERREPGTVIENNLFENSFYGIYIAHQDDLTINGNYITPNDVSNDHNYGIYCMHCYNEFEMVGNRIIMDNTGNQRALYLMSCDGNDDGVAHRGLIANNMVTAGGGSTSEGLYANGTTYKDFYFNSFHCYGSSTTGGSKGFYINGPSDGHNNLVNNIFTCVNGTHIYNSITTAIEHSDSNDYYSEAPDPDRWGYWGGQVHNLAELQAASGDDANSISADPVYVDPFATATDLHITSSSPVQDIAVPIASVTDDIDGDIRNAFTPDIGADEDNMTKVWTGNIDTDWDIDGNWNPVGVPNQDWQARIPADPESDPDNWPIRSASNGDLVIGNMAGDDCYNLIIDGSASASTYQLTVEANLQIRSGANLICDAVETDKPTIKLDGNWNNEGVFTAGNSVVTFDGDADIGSPQLIAGTATSTFNIIEIKDTFVELNGDASDVNWDTKIIVTETTGDARLILPAPDGGEPNMIDVSP